MAFNEFEVRGRVHVLSDCCGDMLAVRTMGDCLAMESQGDDGANMGFLFEPDDKDSVRAFANVLLRWCEAGSL